MLRRGGSAADAFVAAVLVQDVVLPGVTSTAGLAGILVYEAKTKKLTYVHGGLADPIDAARRYTPGDAGPGKWGLVPGAPAAYSKLVGRFGKMPLHELVEPAATLAAEGFAADALYSSAVAANRAKLEGSAYGRKSFFPNGRGIREGDILKLARTLRAFGRDPSLFHRGAWARDAVALVKSRGGALTERDFETYAPEVAPPIHGTFMGYDLYAAGYGGMKLLVTLFALETLREGRAKRRAHRPKRSSASCACSARPTTCPWRGTAISSCRAGTARPSWHGRERRC